MKILKIFIILFSVTSFSELKSDEVNDVLKNKILKNIRCLICQGQSVYDSESEFASSIKLIVDRKINEGLKEKQIYQPLKLRTLIQIAISIQIEFLKKALFIL